MILFETPVSPHTVWLALYSASIDFIHNASKSNLLRINESLVYRSFDTLVSTEEGKQRGGEDGRIHLEYFIQIVLKSLNFCWAPINLVSVFIPARHGAVCRDNPGRVCCFLASVKRDRGQSLHVIIDQQLPSQISIGGRDHILKLRLVSLSVICWTLNVSPLWALTNISMVQCKSLSSFTRSEQIPSYFHLYINPSIFFLFTKN